MRATGKQDVRTQGFRSWRGRAVILVFVALTSVVSVAPARADHITSKNVAAKIAAAKTPAQHAALAKYFHAQAAMAAAKAKEHQEMLDMLTGKLQENLGPHCQALIASYKELEKEYEAIAQAQEQAAKETAGK